MEGDYLRRSVAEFVGAFALIFVGVGSTIYGNIVGVAFAHGLVIAVMASAVGHISGGHFNPAVTLGFLVTRRMAVSLAAAYWIAQLLGALLAALLLKWVLPGTAVEGIHDGAPSLQNGLNGGEGVVVEAVLTFFLVWVIFATAADPRGAFKQIAGLAIGLTITLDVLMGGGLTGAVMNPARSLGPEIAANHWADFWVYLIGPFSGAVIAAVVYELLYLRPPRPVPVGPPETGLEEPRPGDAALE
jgi:aquaporin TIP